MYKRQIVTCIPDQTMSQSVVDKCKDAGVPIIAVDDGLIDTDGNKIAPWFGIDAYNIGYTAGEWMADYAKKNDLLDDPSVGLLYMTMETVSSCVPRTEGEKDAWKDKLGDALSDRTYAVSYTHLRPARCRRAGASRRAAWSGCPRRPRRCGSAWRGQARWPPRSALSCTAARCGPDNSRPAAPAAGDLSLIHIYRAAP